MHVVVTTRSTYVYGGGSIILFLAHLHTYLRYFWLMKIGYGTLCEIRCVHTLTGRKVMKVKVKSEELGQGLVMRTYY